MTEQPTILLVFLYEQLNLQGKRIGIWRQVSQSDLDDGTSSCVHERIYNRRLKGAPAMSRARPGQVFKVPTDGDAANAGLFGGLASYAGLWRNLDARLEWAAKHKANTAAADAEAFQKRDGSNELLEALEPIARAYRQARGRQRDALLAAVVSRIVRGSL